MDPMTMGALVGAGTGLAKGYLVDQPRERRQRMQEAQIAMYSPWTGMSPRPVQEADPFGSALQGGLTGAQFGKQFGGAGASTPDGSAGAMGGGVDSQGVPDQNNSWFAWNKMGPQQRY